MILTDRRNPKAVQLAAHLAERLPEGWDPGVHVVLGGDGTMLRAVTDQGLDRPFLGLNCGYLGFLMNDVGALDDPGAMDDLVERLVGQRWRTWRFPLLEGRVRCIDGSHQTVRAMNDITLQRESGHAAKLRLTVDGSELVDSLGCDGLVVATALGSTAYSFSAGGTPLHPTVEAMLVTPICPHRPRLSPVALPASAEVTVQVLAADRRPVAAVADGVQVASVSEVTIGYADVAVELAWFDDHDFTAHLIHKILKP